MSELWKRVDSCRAKKGISLKQLGEICGISPQGVQKWKQTGRIPVEHLTTLSAYFSITIDALIGINPDDQLHPGQAAPAPPPAILAVAPPATAPPCRYPADCDLPHELADMKAQLSTLSTQVETLTRLLGATLAANTSHDKQKAS
jgi:transcriptional regulator with XRE-family HTH domain